MIDYIIKAEPVGFVVYAKQEGTYLSLGLFASANAMDILEVTGLMAKEGGFKAESADALAFFLFEDRAQSFVERLKAR